MCLFDILVHLEIAEKLLLFLSDHDQWALRRSSRFLFDYCNPQFIQWQLDIALSYFADLCRDQAIESELEATFCILHPDLDWTWESD